MIEALAKDDESALRERRLPTKCTIRVFGNAVMHRASLHKKLDHTDVKLSLLTIDRMVIAKITRDSASPIALKLTALCGRDSG
jgi:hypothetical protein